VTVAFEDRYQVILTGLLDAMVVGHRHHMFSHLRAAGIHKIGLPLDFHDAQAAPPTGFTGHRIVYPSVALVNSLCGLTPLGNR
jgi:hypothetical protein